MNYRILLFFVLLLCGTGALAQPGNALHFDGVNDKVEIPDANPLDLQGSYTLECWIRPDEFTWLGGLISKYHSASANGYLLRLGSASPYNGLGFDGMETPTGLLQTGTWYHIAAVKDGPVRKIYVNGEEKPLSGGAVNVGPNTDILTLGMDYAPAPRYFKGAMDEVRIWNTARSQGDIQSAMNTSVDPASSGLVAYYKFDQGTADGDNTGLPATVTDATANNNNGTAVNFAFNGSTSNWISRYFLEPPVATEATGISDDGFTAHWTPGGAADYYLLDISPSADFSTFVSGYNGLNVGNVTAWDAAGLLPGVTWYYRVSAVSTIQGQSAPSNFVAVATSGEFVPQTPILYVDKNVAGGDQSGTSWANAMPELANALQWARTNQGSGLWSTVDPLRIWVAAGTYKPLYHAADGQFTNNGNRNNAFVLVRDVQLYGGFDPANGITDLTHQRILSPAGSVLSGDLNNSNTLNNGDAYHVVISAGAAGSAVFDGFTVTGGNSNGSGGAVVVNELEVYNDNGGGVCAQTSSPVLRNLTISGNYGYWGGGMQLQNSSPSITRLVISGNRAGYGGGINIDENTSLVLTNVMISGNRAASYGGGIHAVGSSITLTNVTISGNKADIYNGGGIYYLQSTLQVRNSIIFGNNTGVYPDNSLPPQCRHSLVQEITTGDDADGNISGGANPLFVNRIAYSLAPSAGGSYALQAGSPAVNKGSNALFPGLGAGTADLAGNPRVYDYAGGGGVDMGAYEYQGEPGIPPTLGGTLYVNKNVSGGDQSGSSWDNAMPELAEALKWARQNVENDLWDAGSPLQIWVATGTYKPLYRAADGQFETSGSNRNNAFVLVRDVQLYGGFDPAHGIFDLTHSRIPPTATSGSILSGDINTSNTNDAYHVVIGTNALGTAVLDGFTITGGNANGSHNASVVNSVSIFNDEGGGIELIRSHPVLNNLVIAGNYATYGGGMMLQYASPVMTNLVFSLNSGRWGGGIMNGGGTITLTNVTISGNSDVFGGGGIFTYDAVLVRNSIIYGNTGGVMNYGSIAPQYTNSLVQGQTVNDANGNLAGATDPKFTSEPTINLPFGDYMLQAGSPAIEAGSNTLFAGLDAATTDLAGNPRVSGTNIDMGAYEYFEPLPVTLVDFKAVLVENAVQLTWQTTEEVNASHFEIQRGTDARTWEAIGNVPVGAAGYQTYTFNDPLSEVSVGQSATGTPAHGRKPITCYYRLRMVDRDGTFAYSQIAAVQIEGIGMQVRIYPNPAKKEKVIVELTGGAPGAIRVQIYDRLGRAAGGPQPEIVGGKAILDVSGLASGLYLVQIGQGNAVVTKHLVIP